MSKFLALAETQNTPLSRYLAPSMCSRHMPMPSHRKTSSAL